jgi:hypothetical protein
MTIEELKKEYPKLTAKIEDLDDLKSLVVVDENYEDEEADDSVEFDCDEYNYMIYIPEQACEALGEDAMISIANKFEQIDGFDDFLASEIDLFGIKTDLDEISIAKIVLDAMEKELV